MRLRHLLPAGPSHRIQAHIYAAGFLAEIKFDVYMTHFPNRLEEKRPWSKIRFILRLFIVDIYLFK